MQLRTTLMLYKPDNLPRLNGKSSNTQAMFLPSTRHDHRYAISADGILSCISRSILGLLDADLALSMLVLPTFFFPLLVFVFSQVFGICVGASVICWYVNVHDEVGGGAVANN